MVRQPVSKTAGPKGFGSSNLPPSATLLVDGEFYPINKPLPNRRWIEILLYGPPYFHTVCILSKKRTIKQVMKIYERHQSGYRTPNL